jgi:hypothetical protein
MDFNRKGQMVDFKVYNSVMRRGAAYILEVAARRRFERVPLEEADNREALH